VKIPFVDLKLQHRLLGREIKEAIQSVIEETAFVRGKYVAQFEQDFRERYGVKHCISVANGTDAIYIVLRALGIGQGDEVITVANSWISTSETISQVGARPVFIDVEPDLYTINPTLIEEKITAKTKAIIPVHLYGQPAKIDTLREICDRHDLQLVEDCAQAHFAEYKNERVGTFGRAGTFSFYPGKNLGAYGDAGAIITNDDSLALKMRMLANHGSLEKHDHQIEGINSRLDGIQAAILSVKLPHLDEWNHQRLKHALKYNKLLADVSEVTVPKIRDDASHVFHLYVIRTRNRDQLREFLANKGISTGIHYPTALPFLPAYRYLGYSRENFPVASRYQDEILSLPMFPQITEAQIEHVAGTIQQFFEECRSRQPAKIETHS